MVKIPDHVRDVFEEPALAHVSYLNAKGQVVTWPMWADYDGHFAYIGSPVGSRKGKALRERPNISISIVSNNDPWHWVSISGRVVDIQPDHELEFIDRMAHKYTGKEYQRRSPREIFKVEIDRVSPSAK